MWRSRERCRGRKLPADIFYRRCWEISWVASRSSPRSTTRKLFPAGREKTSEAFAEPSRHTGVNTLCPSSEPPPHIYFEAVKTESYRAPEVELYPKLTVLQTIKVKLWRVVEFHV